MLNGLDRNGQQIVDQANFFLQKWFRVSDAAEHAVEAGHGVEASANFVMGREDVLAGFLVAELRFVSHQGGKFSVELFRDVDDERGANVVVKRGVDDLEGAMGREGRVPVSRRKS